MGLESATFISELDNSFPLGGDPINQGDDHIRLVKAVLQSQFPNFTAAAANMTITELNLLVGLLADAAELNILNGALLDTAELNTLNGILSTTAELNRLQSYVAANNRAIISDGSGNLVVSGVTVAELNILDGATISTAELNFLVGVLGAIIDTQGGQTIADLIITNDLTLNGELVMNAGYSEDADQYTATTGTRGLDTSAATYFFPSANLGTAVITFTFDNPATSGRVTSFTMELLGADDATLTWPTSVDWAGGTEPIWTSGRDIATFVTRDGGTTWYGFAAGLDMS